MGKNWKPSSPWLRRKAKQGFRGYPLATIAFYGPTDTLATKIVVSIVRDEGRDPDPLERWFSEDTDVRNDPSIGDQILAFLKEHGAKSVIATDSLIGCPHEEGIDYPEGKSCPRCPYWAGRDRFARERIQRASDGDSILLDRRAAPIPRLSAPIYHRDWVPTTLWPRNAT